MPATTFQAEWNTIKSAFIKNARDMPPEVSMMISQGHDFGPALKSFDSASTFEKRMKALPAVLKAKTGYEREIQDVLKTTPSKVAQKGLQALMNNIDQLYIRVNDVAQPPRPSGRMVSGYVLRQFDLSAGVKPVYLKVDPIIVTADIEVDSEFKKLMDAGEAGLRLDDLGEAALKELGTLKDAFKATIMAVDATIAKDLTQLDAKTKEANEVLQHYGKIVNDNVVRAVQAEWDKYLSRKKDLSDFRIKSGVKVVLGTVGVAVAVASVVLSFGTAWMNIVAACKGIMDVGKSIKTWAEDIDEVYVKLLDDADEITKLNVKRAAGGGQKASKAKQMGKEVAAAALPFAKDMVKATSAMEARCKQFSGLISKMESSENTLSGKIEVISKNLTSLPNRFLDTVQINLSRRAGKTVESLLKELQELHAKVKKCIKFAENVMKAIKKLKDEDSWVAKLEAAGGLTGKGVAILALVNFMVECADHGKTIVQLVSVVL
jgi:hypothetical protein